MLASVLVVVEPSIDSIVMPLSLRRSRIKRLISQQDESSTAPATEPAPTAPEPLPRLSDARLFVSDGLSLVANSGSIPFEPVRLAFGIAAAIFVSSRL